VYVDAVSVGAATVIGTTWTRTWTPASVDGQVTITALSVSVSPYVLANTVFGIDATDPASYTGSSPLTSLKNQVSGVAMSTVTGTPAKATDACTGLQYFFFDGASYLVGTEAAVLAAIAGTNKPFTFWIVQQREAIPNANIAMFSAGDSAIGGNAWSVLESAGRYYFEKLGNPTGARDWDSRTVREGLVLHQFRSADGLTVFHSIDGDAETSETLTSPGALSPNRFAVGVEPRSTFQFPYGGRIHQIIFCDASKSGAVATAVNTRLLARWRSAANVSPLGDSLTRVTPYAPAGGWRKALLDWAIANSKRIDLQGPFNDGTFADPWHGGVAGNTIAQISTRATAYYGAAGLLPKTQLVCLMCGTNNLADIPNGLIEYGNLLTQIHNAITATVPAARIAVTTIPPIQSSTLQDTWNAGLPSIWNTFDSAHPSNTLLRWNANLALGGVWSSTYWGGTGDSTHPNETGSQLMATHSTYGLLTAIGPYLSSIG
jgi:hypothetical protein